jgi:hypothetical protein
LYKDKVLPPFKLVVVSFLSTLLVTSSISNFKIEYMQIIVIYSCVLPINFKILFVHDVGNNHWKCRAIDYISAEVSHFQLVTHSFLYLNSLTHFFQFCIFI